MEPVSHFETLYPDTARFDDIQKLSIFIKNGASCQLLGVPGVGRGTVLNLLANSKKIRTKHFEDEKTHFVLVNFSEIRKRPLPDVMKFLFLNVCDSLRARSLPEYKKVNDLFKDSLKFKDELVLFQALKEAMDYLCYEKGYKIVFLFDRFEEYVPTVTPEFFGNLRTLRTRAKYQFSVVFSLTRPLEDILEPTQLSDFYEFVAGNNVYLSLKDDTTTNFRVSYIEKITKKKIPEPVFKQILHLTGGMGLLVKLAVEAVLSRPPSLRSSVSGQTSLSKPTDLGEFLFSQKLMQGALMDICRSLKPSEQVVLIHEKYEDTESIEYLSCVGLLAGKTIKIPLFAQHIATHKGQSIGQKKIVFDEQTNTIKMGDSVFDFCSILTDELLLLIFTFDAPSVDSTFISPSDVSHLPLIQTVLFPLSPPDVSHLPFTHTVLFFVFVVTLTVDVAPSPLFEILTELAAKATDARLKKAEDIPIYVMVVLFIESPLL